MSKDRRSVYRVNRKCGMTRYNAAIASGYSVSLAERRGVPATPTADFVSLFERKCMTNEKKVEKVLDGMNATKDNKPDWPTRYKYTELMFKLCNQLDKKENTSTEAISNLANVLREARERVNEGLRRIVVQQEPEYTEATLVE